LLSTLSAFAPPETPQYVQLALTLTFMVGAMGFAKLGTLVNFISRQVVLGFTAGAAVLIAVNQIKNFVGLPIPRGPSPSFSGGRVATAAFGVAGPRDHPPRRSWSVAPFPWGLPPVAWRTTRPPLESQLDEGMRCRS